MTDGSETKPPRPRSKRDSLATVDEWQRHLEGLVFLFRHDLVSHDEFMAISARMREAMRREGLRVEHLGLHIVKVRRLF